MLLLVSVARCYNIRQWDTKIMADAVLVTDMLRGFCEEGYPLYVGKPARRIIPNIQRLLERENARGSKVFYICDQHAPDDREFELFPPHCIIGTPETEIIPELSEYTGEIIPKTCYSGFYGTILDDKLSDLRPGKLVVCGVCTDICILFTVADARNRDYTVEVPVDCVASFNEKAHEFALGHMQKILGARLVNTE